MILDYGLVCHRAIKAICELAGIRNIHVKVEGSKSNNVNIAKAFLNALAYQVSIASKRYPPKKCPAKN